MSGALGTGGMVAAMGMKAATDGAVFHLGRRRDAPDRLQEAQEDDLDQPFHLGEPMRLRWWPRRAEGEE